MGYCMRMEPLRARSPQQHHHRPRCAHMPRLKLPIPPPSGGLGPDPARTLSAPAWIRASAGQGHKKIHRSCPRRTRGHDFASVLANTASLVVRSTDTCHPSEHEPQESMDALSRTQALGAISWVHRKSHGVVGRAHRRLTEQGPEEKHVAGAQPKALRTAAHAKALACNARLPYLL